MAKGQSKDTTEDQTTPTPAAPGGGAIPESAFAADLAAAKAAQDANAEQAEAHKVPDEALTDEAREVIAAGEQRQEEEQAKVDAKREAAETVGADQTTSEDD